MRGFRFFLIGIVSFIITTSATIFVSGSFLNRIILAASCVTFSLNYALCTPDFGVESDPVIAANTLSIEPNNNQLDKRIYLTQKQPSLSSKLVITPVKSNGCKIVLNTKNVDGKPFPDSVQYTTGDKKTCGNSFTSRINPNGNGATVIEDTDRGSVIHQFDNLPGQGVQVTTKYPDGGSESFTIKPLNPGDDGIYVISVTGRDGKTQTGTTTIPKSVKENLPSKPPSGDGANGDKSESSYCKIARNFCKVV